MSDEKWIQGSIKHEGRVRKYVNKLYGAKGFDESGAIKKECLDKAYGRAKAEGAVKLADAIREAQTLKKIGRERQKMATA